MEKSQELEMLATALAKAQGEIKAAALNSANPFLHSKYADLASIVDAAREPLSKNGLSITQVPFTENNAIGIETILLHSSGQWVSGKMSLPLEKAAGLTLAQVAGSAITYLRRYSYASMVGVVIEDDDGSNAGNRNEKQNKSKGKNGAEVNEEEENRRALLAWEAIKVGYKTLASLSLEAASKVTTSNGELYGSIQPWRLVKMLEYLANARTNPDNTPEIAEGLEYKMSAIKALLDAEQSKTFAVLGKAE